MHPLDFRDHIAVRPLPLDAKRTASVFSKDRRTEGGERNKAEATAEVAGRQHVEVCFHVAFHRTCPPFRNADFLLGGKLAIGKNLK
jgi:hypothetical protein